MDTGMCICPGFKGSGCGNQIHNYQNIFIEIRINWCIYTYFLEFCRTGLVKSGGLDNSNDCYVISHQKMTFYEAQGLVFKNSYFKSL